MAIIDEETKILRQILESEVPPSDIEQKVKKAKNLRLRDNQNDFLKVASNTLSYSEFDITLLYTLIRNICTKVEQPTNGWGETPGITDTTVGDDIERIRLMRNEVYGHVSNTWMSDADFQSHWSTINDVCVRMDRYFLSKKVSSRFESELKEIKERLLDEQVQEQYINIIKEMEENKKQQEEIIVKLKEYIIHTQARGSKVHKMYKEITLTNKTERELSVKLTDSYLQDVGALINGVEKFINDDSMIEECIQLTKSLFSEGFAVTKRKCHDDINLLQTSVQESKALLCPLQQDQELSMLIDILTFVMSLKKYECILHVECFGGSLVICFTFSISHRPDSQKCQEIDTALRNLILQEEHLSLYKLPKADSLILVTKDVDKMAIGELRERKGKKRKAECDDDQEIEALINDDIDDDFEIMSSENNENQMKVDSLERTIEDMQLLSDEENDEMDTTVERGLNLKLFQEELTEIAKKGHNTIVCSETGTGKTRIAFAIIKDHLEKNHKGRVAILANNTILVDQHYKTLNSLLPEFEDSSIRLSGNNKRSKNLHLFVEFLPIIIMTPALIMNTIETGRDPKILSRFTLLVFDECHHTYGDHIFNKVMRHYHMERDKGNKIPQILGLTATLGTGSANYSEKAKSHILGIMANLDVEELSTVTREKDDYQNFLKDVKKEFIQLEKQNTKDSVGEVLQNFMEMLEEKVQSLKGNLSHTDCEEDAMLNIISNIPEPEKRNCSVYITWCNRLYEAAIRLMGKKSQLAKEIKLYAKYLQIVCECLEINDCIRGESAVLTLKEKLEQENFHLPSQDQLEDKLAKMAENLKRKIQEQIPIQLKNRHIDKLLELLQHHVKEGSVVIIFVKTRELAYQLTIFLNKEGYRFERLTGHSAGDGGKATSQDEQGRIKAKLVACKLQGIVATDIAGEGLDLENCSCAIRYKCAGNEISSIQIKGRVRRDKGTCITLGEGHHNIREKLNAQRILLMIEAVNHIVNMTKEELKETLDDLRKDIVLQEKRRQKIEKENNLKKEECSKYALSCKRCGNFDINCENIFLISGKHHVVIDTTISEKIIQKPLKKKAYIDVDAGLEQNKEWYHNNCVEKMGTVYLYKGVHIPFLGQGRFVYYRKEDDPRVPELVKNWKLVPFEKSLREVGEEQLTKMAGVL